MRTEHVSAYEALKRHGHSPAKAAEIILDAERGDPHAMKWVVMATGRLFDEDRDAGRVG